MPPGSAQAWVVLYVHRRRWQHTGVIRKPPVANALICPLVPCCVSATPPTVHHSPLEMSVRVSPSIVYILPVVTCRLHWVRNGWTHAVATQTPSVLRCVPSVVCACDRGMDLLSPFLRTVADGSWVCRAWGPGRVQFSKASLYRYR